MQLGRYAGAVALVCSFTAVAACGSGSLSGAGHEHSGQSTPIDPTVPRLEMVAKSFSFEPDEIQVNVGDKRTLVMRVQDVVHDFTVRELDIHVGGDAGEVVTAALTFDKAGTFEFYCSVAGHREAGMEGRLRVSSPS